MNLSRIFLNVLGIASIFSLNLSHASFSFNEDAGAFVNCKKLSEEERSADPCCQKGGAYECIGGTNIRDTSENILVGEVGSSVDVAYNPQGFVLKKKVDPKKDTSFLSAQPAGTLFRRAQVVATLKAGESPTSNTCYQVLAKEVTWARTSGQPNNQNLLFVKTNDRSLYTFSKEKPPEVEIQYIANNVKLDCRDQGIVAKKRGEEVKSVFFLSSNDEETTRISYLFVGQALNNSGMRFSSGLYFAQDNSVPILATSDVSQVMYNRTVGQANGVVAIVQGLTNMFILFGNGFDIDRSVMGFPNIRTYAKQKFQGAPLNLTYGIQ